MQQRQALLAALASVTAAAAGSLPRGVGPDFASHYQAKGDFACITVPSVKNAPSRINDNSCDCPDGSDEPGTAACAHIDPLSPEQPLPGSPSGTTNATKALPGFWCANKGHVGAYVPFVYVNDGVCDYDVCCDGSEEFGRVKCEDRCADIGKEHRALEAEKRKKMQKAQKTRDAMLAEASGLRRQAESKLARLKADVAALEAQKTELEAKHAEAKAHDTGRVVGGGGGSGGKLGVLVNLARTRVGELRDTLGNVVQERDRLRSKVDELQALLTKLKTDYNPNFNDEGVKAAIKSFEDFAARDAAEAPSAGLDTDIDSVLKEDGPESGVNWDEFEDEGQDTDALYNLEAYLPSFVRGLLHDKMQGLRVWLVRNGIVADSAKGGESQVVKAAREAAEAAAQKVQDKQRDLDGEEADLAKDYGPSDIFRALKGKRVSIEAGEYTYELTWLEQTSQNSKKGGGSTNMGNFARVDREMADDEERLDGKSLGKGERMVMRYEDGLQCWNGPRRRTDVWLGCADKEELWRVSEAEKCVYKMEVGTPAACEDEARRGGGGGGGGGSKDEL